MKLKTPSRSVSSLALCMVLLLATTIGAQQLSTRGTEDGKTARLVADMISQYHIKQSTIDDKISEQLLTQFLKQVDSQKLYFTQADIDSFSEHKDKLDDLIKAGNVEFPFLVYDRFMKRLDERIATAQTWIDAEHDFTLDETMVIDADKIPWAQSEDDMKERWRKRIKYDLLSLKLQDKTLEEARKQLHKRYEILRITVHQTENSEKLESYLSALCHCFDPHSSYMSPETLEDFQIQMRLSLEGIGAALKSEDGYVTVAEIVPGGAAAEDGRLKAGDKIIGVAQEEGDFVDVVEMKLSKVVRFIRGKKGTMVRLKVEVAKEKEEKKEAPRPEEPPAKPEVKVYELTRKTIELKSSEVKGEIINSGDRLKEGNLRLGVIHIPSFYRDFSGAQDGTENFKSTARDVRAVLRKFKEQGGVDCVVVDLRNNGGGALKEAIDVTGLFIDQGPVVQIKEPDGNVKSHDDEEGGVAYSGPMVVVCNRLSASASEIFAGAIRDYGRGIVIGDTTTHGKGTVQNVMAVPNRGFSFLGGGKQQRGALKLTINQFYRVNGDSTQNRGVESDVVLPSLIDHMDLGESFLDNALAFDRVPEATHEAYARVTPDLVSALKKSSQARIAADEKFQETQKEIERFLERKNRKAISLNEETLRKERKADKEQEKVEEELKDSADKKDGPIFPEGNYNDEILRLSLDYVGLVKAMKTAGK